MKTGLVLEGGAMRGLFTAGVLDVWMENNVTVDGAIGVSAGAVFGCNYKSGQIGRVLRYNTQYCKDPRYCSFRSLLFTGDLYGADFCYRRLPRELDVFDAEAYNQNPMAFYIVATNVHTGQPHYQECPVSDEESLDWYRASASMPLASRIVSVGGLELLDGGVSDSIPLAYFQSIGYERNIVVLTQPEGYQKKPNKLMPLMRLWLRKYPKLLEAMENRHLAYNQTLEELQRQEAEGRILVLRPDAALPVGHVEHDPDKLHQAYQLGRDVAMRRLEEVRAFLAKAKED